MFVAGVGLVGLRAFGSRIDVLRSNGVEIWRTSSAREGAEPAPPAGDNYIHSLWGNTERLSRPKPLENYLYVTDIHRGKPSGGWEETGPGGQKIAGMWFDITGGDTRSACSSGERDPSLYSPGVITPSQLPSIYQVLIDGNGGDVWVDCASNSSERVHDFPILISNARHVRLSGVRTFVDDIRKICGGWPDGNYWSTSTTYPSWWEYPDPDGPPSPFHLHWVRCDHPDAQLFVEGMDWDVNYGGAYPNHRVDFTFPRQHGDKDDMFANPTVHIPTGQEPKRSLIFQNSRVEKLAGDTFDTEIDPHADLFKLDYEHGLRWVICENCELNSNYQTFLEDGSQIDEGAGEYARPYIHVRFYNTKFFAKAVGQKVPPLITLQANASFDTTPSFEFHNCEWTMSDVRYPIPTCAPTNVANNANKATDPGVMFQQKRGEYPIGSASNTGDGNRFSLDGSDYQGGFTIDKLRYQDYGDGYGDRWTHFIANMIDPVTHEIDLLCRIADPWPGRDTVTPTAHIGYNFKHIWDANGNLLAE